MAKLGRLWRLAPVDARLRTVLSRTLGVSPIVAQILINRGIADEASARDFLYSGAERLSDPFVMKDMQRSVERITHYINNKQKITIYGDYDVDGITASALMVRVLTDLGAKVEYYIPERQSEGYGLNSAALEQLARTGTKLVVTVDCGISAVKEVAAMMDKLDIIITDHHQPPETLPLAYAILNPKQFGCPFVDKQLAGVGVAFKLCQALWQRYYPDTGLLQNYLDIVAMGTIADIVPLVGENRTLVKLGLRELQTTANVGLQALKDVCGITDQRIDTSKVGYVLAPRLNAAGRIHHGAAGVELLITADKEKALELALLLNQENTTRQLVEREILVAADERAMAINIESDKVLVISGEDWHPGVIGIVASRLVEKYYRPVVMITIKDGIGKGSCRSIPGFDMYDALKSASDLLIQFGGHRQAAGLSIDSANIEALRIHLTQYASKWLQEEDYIPKITIDSLIALDEVDTNLLEQMACLEPHGMSNPSPVFACSHVKLADIRSMGQDRRHIKLRVNRQNTTTNVIGWNMGVLSDTLRRDDYIDLAFIPEFNDWQGVRSVQLRAHDVKVADKHLSPIDIIRTNLILKDARQTVDKISYLRTIIELGNKTVIYVNSSSQVDAVTSALRHLMPQIACQIGSFNLKLTRSEQEQLKKRFQTGQLVAVVATSEFGEEVDLPDIRHVVLYHMPFSRISFHLQCSKAGWDGQPSYIHLLFGNDDINLNQMILNEIAPERSIIVHVYLALKELSCNNSQTKLTYEQITSAIRARFDTALCKKTVIIALIILAELTLITQQASESCQIIHLAPAPAQKLDLEQSPTYREGIAKQQAFRQFSSSILQNSAAELLIELNQPIFNRQGV